MREQQEAEEEEELLIITTPSAAEPGWAGAGVADGVTRSQKSAGRVPPTPPCCPPRHDASAACCSAADLLPFLCHGALQRGPCCVAACSHHLSDQSRTGRVQGPAIRCPLVGHHHANESCCSRDARVGKACCSEITKLPPIRGCCPPPRPALPAGDLLRG